MRSSGITVFNRDFQRLHSIHSTRRIQGILPVLILHPEDKRALRVILHAEDKEIFYPVYKAFQPQDLPQAFQFYMDIPDIPVIHDIPAFQAFSSISLIKMQNLHIDWFPPETPLSANQYKTFYKHYILQRKGDVVISVIRHYSTE